MNNNIKIVFSRRNTLSSYLIRFFTNSNYSHCALMLNNEVIDATYKNGVSKKLKKDFFKENTEYLICYVDNLKEEKCWNWALSQIGKGYDFLALVGWFFRKNWCNENKYFCSEFVTQALYNGDCWLFRKSASRITPQDLLNLAAIKPE